MLVAKFESLLTRVLDESELRITTEALRSVVRPRIGLGLELGAFGRGFPQVGRPANGELLADRLGEVFWPIEELVCST